MANRWSWLFFWIRPKRSGLKNRAEFRGRSAEKLRPT
jgi:hypothetical protein